jgi:pimeloyl-ACP methyl ester carboxylesterase
MDDIRAVMDAAGSRRAALFGVSDGGCLCIAFAVAHPERSASLVTYRSFARRLRSAGYPWGWSAEHLAEVLRGMDRGWASGKWWAAANPSVADDEGYQAWWVPLTDETSPACVIGAFEIALGSVYATDEIAERFRSGGGFAWGAHDQAGAADHGVQQAASSARPGA